MALMTVPALVKADGIKIVLLDLCLKEADSAEQYIT